MIVPQELICHINTDYPKSNKVPFEEWFIQQSFPELEREIIKIPITSWWVNHNYGNDVQAKQKMQSFFDGLDRSKKYAIVCQYDDQLLIDTNDLDIVTFGMSYRLPEQKPTYVIPLIGQMGHRLIREKKYKASFIGSRTHPMRDEIVSVLSGKKDYFVSTEPFRPQDYFDIMAESEFVIAPAGYALPSFRAFEAIHNYAIPVYVWDEDLMEPYGIPFNEYGVTIQRTNIPIIQELIESHSQYSINLKIKRAEELYRDLCTYEGVYDYIIKTLQNEV